MKPQDLQEFLENEEFTISNTQIVDQFDPSAAQDLMSINTDNLGVTKNEVVNALVEAALKGDNVDKPKNVSYQPLNEAAYFLNGGSSKSEIASSIANNTIQEDNMSSVDSASRLVEEEDKDVTEETKAKMEECAAANKVTTQSVANIDNQANSSIKMAGAKFEIGTNFTSINADVAIHTNAPKITELADRKNTQLGVSEFTADLGIGTYKNKLDVTEGTSTTVNKESINATTGKLTVAASTQNNTTTGRYKVTAQSQLSISQEGHLTQATEHIVQAMTSSTTQSGTVNVIAATGSTLPLSDTPNVLGQSDFIPSSLNDDGSLNVVAQNDRGDLFQLNNVKESTGSPKWQLTGAALEGRGPNDINPATERLNKGNLNLIAKGSGSQSGIMTVLSDTSIQSTVGANYTTTGGPLIQVSQESITNSGPFITQEATAGITNISTGFYKVQVGNTGKLVANGFTFDGMRFGTLKKLIDEAQNAPLEIRQLPNFIPVPSGIQAADLANCLPKRYRDKEDIDNPIENEEEQPDDIIAPNQQVLQQREKPRALPTGRDPSAVVDLGTNDTSAGNESGDDTTTSEERGGIFYGANSTSAKKSGTDTPLSNNTDPTTQDDISEKNSYMAGAAIFSGGSDIFLPERLPEEFDLFKRTGADIIDPDSGEESGGPELTKRLINAITDAIIDDAVDQLSLLDESGILAKENLEIVKKYLFKQLEIEEEILDNSEKINPNEEETINKLIENNEVKQLIEAIIKDLASRTSTGSFLGFVNNAHNRISSTINIATDFIEDNSNENVFQVLKNASSLARDVTNNDIFTDIGSIIESSNDLSNIFGQVKSVIQSNDVTLASVIDQINFDDIQTIISQGLTRIGVDNLETATSIANILNNIKNSEIYSEQGLSSEVIDTIINQISSQTSLSIGQARGIYNQAQDVIANVLSGDVSSIVGGSELQNILGFFIGSSNASLLSDLRDIYLSGKSIINQGEDIFNQGKELYSAGEDFYSLLKSIPALIGMMNSYEIPLLNQVGIILQCQELIQQASKIIDGVKSIASSFNALGETIEGTFDAFGSLFEDESEVTDTSDALTSISDGFASGNIVPNNSIVEPVAVNIALGNNNLAEFETPNEVLRIITDPTATNALTAGETLTLDNCSNVVFSANATTNDSANPSYWEDRTSDLEVLDIIERLPRLTQIYNSIIETPDQLPVILDGITQTQINDLKQTTINVPQDACFIAPKLSLVESTIDVLDLKNGIMLYKLKFPETLQYNTKNIYPSNGTIVQIYVETFNNLKTGRRMFVHRTSEFLSPHIYSFKTTEYNRLKNLGIAFILPTQTRIHLKTAKEIAYNYSIADIGNKLEPNILDAYIVE